MKRFYREVTTAAQDAGFAVLLDGRVVKTQGGGTILSLPTMQLAEALAAEWRAQGDTIDPATFPNRDLADYAIDIVRADRDAAIATLLGFAQTDTLCYRAEPGTALLKKQEADWEPLLRNCEQTIGGSFIRISGVMPQPQPPALLESLRSRLARYDDHTLAALQSLASLAASLVVALAAIKPDADAAALWSLANLEEDWQAALWGKDAEADAVRQQRARDFAIAANFASLART